MSDQSQVGQHRSIEKTEVYRESRMALKVFPGTVRVKKIIYFPLTAKGQPLITLIRGGRVAETPQNEYSFSRMRSNN